MERTIRQTLGQAKEEHKVNALALGAEEGRDKLRKAAVRSKYPFNPQMSEWGNPPAVMSRDPVMNP